MARVLVMYTVVLAVNLVARFERAGRLEGDRAGACPAAGAH